MYNEADSDANETLTVKLIGSNINILKSFMFLRLHVPQTVKIKTLLKPNSKRIPLDITWSSMYSERSQQTVYCKVFM